MDFYNNLFFISTNDIDIIKHLDHLASSNHSVFMLVRVLVSRLRAARAAVSARAEVVEKMTSLEARRPRLMQSSTTTVTRFRGTRNRLMMVDLQ